MAWAEFYSGPLLPSEPMGYLCVGHAPDQGGDGEQKVERKIRQGKDIGLALRESVGFIFGTPAKKGWPLLI